MAVERRKERRAAARVAGKARPKISLAMIVRNEAEGLERCLLSVAAGVDEIVIVDTGSTDDTMAIARRFTEHVCEMPWSDDFSAARQYAFDRCSGEWILWLDGDDEFTGHLHLRELARSASADVGSFAFPYVTGLDEHGAVTCQFWRERLVRRGAYRWAGRVHEVLVPTAQLRQVESDRCLVTHHGKAGAGRGGLERNVRILREELAAAASPSPRTLFYLARDLMQLGQTDEAAALFPRYLILATWAEERYVALLYVARLHLLRGAYPEAYTAALEALGEWPAWPQAYFLAAEIAYYRQQWPRVMAWCDIGRGLPVPDAGLFVDPLALRAGWIIYYTNALWHTGHLEEALLWTRLALEHLPDDLYHKRNLAFFTAAALGASGGAPRAPGAELTAPQVGPA